MDTRPELVVRRLLHAMGYRFRLHRRDLPGTPDIALSARRALVEVRGCFWHRHPNCRFASVPATRTEFWQAKFDANVARDVRNRMAAEAQGWRTVIVWECELADPERTGGRLRDELGPSRATSWTRRLRAQDADQMSVPALTDRQPHPDEACCSATTSRRVEALPDHA